LPETCPDPSQPGVGHVRRSLCPWVIRSPSWDVGEASGVADLGSGLHGAELIIGLHTKKHSNVNQEGKD